MFTGRVMRLVLLTLIMTMALSSCSGSNESSNDLAYEPTSINEEESVTSDSSQIDWNGECTSDCSGHDAGYQWAEENDISDTDSCSTQSDSFNEGCVAFVEENYGESSGSSYSSDYDPSLYTNCDEVREDGEDPIDSSHPRFGNHLDADGDGVGCEPYYEE